MTAKRKRRALHKNYPDTYRTLNKFGVLEPKPSHIVWRRRLRRVGWVLFASAMMFIAYIITLSVL